MNSVSFAALTVGKKAKSNGGKSRCVSSLQICPCVHWKGDTSVYFPSGPVASEFLINVEKGMKDMWLTDGYSTLSTFH